MKNSRYVSVCALATLMLAACSASPSEPVGTATGSQPAVTTTTTETAAQTTTGTDGESTASDTTREGDGADGSFTSGVVKTENWPSLDAQMLPVASRVGIHDGYDRVVVEYTAAKGEPSWYSEGWVDEAYSSGKGDAIDVDGARSLQIFVGGIAYPDGDAELPNLEPQIPAGSVVTGVDVEYGFEGQHGITIGSDADHNYRISFLENPSRIVIDLEQ